jgi:hypothetical protein
MERLLLLLLLAAAISCATHETGTRLNGTAMRLNDAERQ